MKDSENRSGEEIIQKFGKEVLLELYTSDDLAEDYRRIRRILNDENTSVKDFAMLVKLVWDFTIEKPKTSIEAKVNNGLSTLSDPELIDLVKKKKLDAKNRGRENSVGKNKVKAKG